MTKDIYTGLWEKRIDLPLEGVQYKYAVTNNGITKICIDPYAKASTDNAEWSVIVDMSKTFQVDKNLHPKLRKPTDAIIYEVSIRDFPHLMENTTRWLTKLNISKTWDSLMFNYYLFSTGDMME